MHFIKYEHALCDIVKFSRLRRPVAIDRFKKLHIRRHDDGRIPILRRMPQFFSRRLFFDAVVIEIAMMFQHRILSEQIAKHLGVLFDDARIGNDIDDPLQPQPYRPFQSKIHTGKRLTAARRHVHEIELRILVPMREHLLQKAAPRTGNGSIRRE